MLIYLNILYSYFSLLYASRKALANTMRVYQHSARCPIALRTFLDCNPSYWCLIPLFWHEALADNRRYFHAIDDTTTDPEVLDIMATASVDNPRIARYLDRVPLPPAAYAFSYRQRQEQRLFFERFMLSNIDELPYHAVDLYKIAIIALRK